MAPRVIKLREQGEFGQETEPELFPCSQKIDLTLLALRLRN